MEHKKLNEAESSEKIEDSVKISVSAKSLFKQASAAADSPKCETTSEVHETELPLDNKSETKVDVETASPKKRRLQKEFLKKPSSAEKQISITDVRELQLLPQKSRDPSEPSTSRDVHESDVQSYDVSKSEVHKRDSTKRPREIPTVIWGKSYSRHPVSVIRWTKHPEIVQICISQTKESSLRTLLLWLGKWKKKTTLFDIVVALGFLFGVLIATKLIPFEQEIGLILIGAATLLILLRVLVSRYGSYLLDNYCSGDQTFQRYERYESETSTL